jgi:ribonuclease HI
LSEVTIYTDGACRGNPGPGGWGVLMLAGKKEKTLQGADPETTNNRMEIQAAIEALNVLKRRCRVILYTDSKYVKDGINEWLPNWKTRGWKTSNRKPVKNEDLWRELDRLVADHDVDWRWVKGHSGVAGNERADELANEAIDAMLNGPHTQGR